MSFYRNYKETMQEHTRRITNVFAICDWKIFAKHKIRPICDLHTSSYLHLIIFYATCCRAQSLITLYSTSLPWFQLSVCLIYLVCLKFSLNKRSYVTFECRLPICPRLTCVMWDSHASQSFYNKCTQFTIWVFMVYVSNEVNGRDGKREEKHSCHWTHH